MAAALVTERWSSQSKQMPAVPLLPPIAPICSYLRLLGPPADVEFSPERSTQCFDNYIQIL